MSTATQLTQIFRDNFVAYYRSHVAHVNIMGRNFASDHELLGGIYESLQAQIDTIAELLRTLGEFMPDSIDLAVSGSYITDSPLSGSSEDLLTAVRDDLESLKTCYEELIVIASDEGFEPIGNYAQDRALAIAKQLWMLNATLD